MGFEKFTLWNFDVVTFDVNYRRLKSRQGFSTKILCGRISICKLISDILSGFGTSSALEDGKKANLSQNMFFGADHHFWPHEVGF